MSLLRLRELVCRFGDTTAVDGVDLAVEAGEIVGLLGANGAGKTTTIRMGLGLQRPTSGTVELVGGPPSRQGRRQVGYVPQGMGLWQDLTVVENLAFTARAFGMTAPADLPADLADLDDQLAGDLPLGAQRRVAFTAALGHHPDLLVLDEPTSGVGALERTRLWDTIHVASEEGAGVLVSTHHMSEAEQCDRVVVLMRGRVVAAGTVAGLLEGRRTVVVSTTDWARAYSVLEAHFDAVALEGRSVRVPDAEVVDVRRALGGLDADVDQVPATFDEVFVVLGRAA